MDFQTGFQTDSRFLGISALVSLFSGEFVYVTFQSNFFSLDVNIPIEHMRTLSTSGCELDHKLRLSN